MNREIEFRGRTKNCKYRKNSEWIYGFYMNKDGKDIIVDTTCGSLGMGLEVDGKTVGQYVGIKDKNGKKVYVGDIVKIYYCNNEYIGKVVFNERTCGFEFWYNTVVGAYGEKATHKMNFAQFSKFEVIGNIYEI